MGIVLTQAYFTERTSDLGFAQGAPHAMKSRERFVDP